MHTETDRAYLAAFLDGEGYISIGVRTSKAGSAGHYLVVAVTNTHEGVLRHLHSIWGGALTTPRRRSEKHLRAGDLKWVSRQAAAVLAEIRPYLIIKGDRADIAMAFQATYGTLENGRWSSRVVTEEVWKQREAYRLSVGGQNAKYDKAAERVYAEKPALTCQWCGKEFTSYQKLRKYCSQDCNLKAGRAAYMERTRIEKVCPDCGTTFTTWRKNQTYCSATCGPHGRNSRKGLTPAGTKHR